MKRTHLFLTSLLLIFIGSMACNSDNPIPADTPSVNSPDMPAPMNPPAPAYPGNDTATSRLRIRVGNASFTATLLNNPTVTAFKTRLPFTLSMRELNGNEKFVDLTGSLPANPVNPGTIQAGDLSLYGSTTLVLFYETFRTSYRYTRLGRIDNPTGLATALGTGNATVTFELP